MVHAFVGQGGLIAAATAALEHLGRAGLARDFDALGARLVGSALGIEDHAVERALEEGHGVGTLGLDYQKYVEIDPRYYRPTEVDHLCGDASKAKLGWTPKVRVKELIEMMVKSDEADVRSSLQGRAPTV